MLTGREQQILGWIRANPSISQQEIADRAGISRSSVSVHISNLTKKGAILGRQYVLSDRSYVVVVGATNMDVAGKPDGVPTPRDVTPGAIVVSPGGTARNVAHNLTLLGTSTKLVTALGEDARARELSEGCRGLGIDLKGSVTVPGGTTSTCVFILDEHGNMSQAIADMGILEGLTPNVLERRLDLIDRAAACFVDTNISRESLRFLAEHVNVPLFCDPVSISKAAKLSGLLGHFHAMKPNALEAEALTGVSIHDERSLELAAQRLLDTGLDQVFISLGADGLLCAEQDRTLRLPSYSANVVSATGSGDAMMGAIIWAYLEGKDLEGTCSAGLAVAAISVESASTVNPSLTAGAVRQRMAQPGTVGTPLSAGPPTQAGTA